MRRCAAAQLLEEGLALCSSKSVAKGVAFLVSNAVLQDDAHDIVSFLRMYGDRLNPREVGAAPRSLSPSL
jgi:hypothetical protein